MPKYDWRNIDGEAEPISYSAGEHKVRFDKWFFDTSKNDKVFLQINFEKDGVKKNPKYPFCSCRLFFSSETAVRISRHYLHEICNKMGIEYSKDRVEDDEKVLLIGEELFGREITIILEPTGSKNLKGYDVLGVNIPDVGQLYMKARNEADEAMEIINNSQQVPDDDIPF